MQKLARVGIAVLVVGGVIGLKFYNKGSAEAEIKTNMHAWVANSVGYADDPAYAETLFDQCHEPAFESCYSVGGRRRSARFEDERYIAQLTAAMAAQARKDGREKFATGLEAMKQKYDAAPQN
jgi:hypothetical protein